MSHALEIKSLEKTYKGGFQALKGIDLTAGFTGFSIFGQNIAHFAHLGGALVGFLMVNYYRRSTH